jgi:hypothetical protein
MTRAEADFRGKTARTAAVDSIRAATRSLGIVPVTPGGSTGKNPVKSGMTIAIETNTGEKPSDCRPHTQTNQIFHSVP